MSKGRYGDGGIFQRGPSSYRLRYRIGKQRYSAAFHGTKTEAKQSSAR